jgi:uncharacterized membrane protein YgcG
MMDPMSKPWGSAWRLLAALPFVLLLVIVGIKVTMSQGDPASGPQKPGEHTIFELGDDAPSATVTLPNGEVTTIPKSKISELPSDLQSQLINGITFSPTLPTPKAPKPTKTATVAPVHTTAGGGSTGGGSTSGGGGASSTPDPDPTTHEPAPSQSPTPKCTDSLLIIPLC